MSNMNVKDIPFRAGTAPISAEEAQNFRAKIQKALDENAEAKEWVTEYGDMADKAELEILESKLLSTLTILDHFLATGEWSGPAPAAGPGPGYHGPRDVTPGWNASFKFSEESPPGYENMPDLVPNAEFSGYIYIDGAGETYIDENGDPQKKIEIVLDLPPTTTEVEAFNHGKDIIYVVTYLDEEGNEKKKFWAGMNHAVDTRAEISITGYSLDHGVKIDLSRAFRKSDGSHGEETGKVGGFLVIGTDYDDEIHGSQGDDTLVGLKGDDKIFGYGGIDTLYGDDSYWDNPMEGITAEAVRESLGLRTDLEDGNDTIDGGTGIDIIRGDGGINFGVETDKVSGPKKEDIEGIDHALTNDHNEVGAVFNGGSTRGWKVLSDENGRMVIEETNRHPAEANVLALAMKEGFNMAYAEEEGEDLVITFVKQGEDGEAPQTYTVVVKGALRNRENSLDDPFTLMLNGNDAANIIDFSHVDFKNNNFVIRGKDGDDMIIAPKTILGESGISYDGLTGLYNRISDNETEELLDAVVPGHDNNESGQKFIDARKTGKGEIKITKQGGAEGERTYVKIDPRDFEKGYVMVDPEKPEDLLLVLTRTVVAGEAPKTLVIRIENYRQFQKPGDKPGNFDFLIVNGNATITEGAPEPSPNVIDLVALLTHKDSEDGSLSSGIFIDGGEGDDYAFHAGEGEVQAESQVVSEGEPVAEPVAEPEPDSEPDPEPDPEPEPEPDPEPEA